MSLIYYPNIPLDTDVPSQSASKFNTNFTTLNTVFGEDHVAYNVGTNQGLHKQVTFPLPLPGSPSPINTASVAYPLAGPSLTQLFFSNATQKWQLTGLPIVTATGGATGFGITTPWGIKVNWGNIGSVPSSGRNVTFQVPFTSTPAITCTGRNSDPTHGNVTTQNENASGFSCLSSNTNDVFFIAIGT